MPIFLPPDESPKDVARYREEIARNETLWREHFSLYLSLLPDSQQRRKPTISNRRTWQAAIRSVDGDHELIRDAIAGHIWDDWNDRVKYNQLHHILKRANIERFSEWHKDPKLRPRKEPVYPHLREKHQAQGMLGKVRRKGPPGTPGFDIKEVCVGVDLRTGDLKWQAT